MPPLNLLLVEDSPDDAQLIMFQLEREGLTAEFRRVDTEAAFAAALESPPELILSDFAMPRFNGLRALRILRERGLDIPFILVSGTIGEDVAVDAMKQGADDYLMKDRLNRLGTAVRSALEKKRLRDEKSRSDAALRNSEARYRNIFESIPVSIWEEDFSGVQAALQELRAQGVTDLKAYILEHPEFVVRAMESVQVLDVNDTTLRIQGVKDKSSILGSLKQFISAEEFQEELISYAEGNAYLERETTGYTSDGKLMHFLMSQAFFTSATGRTIALVCFNDITERKQAEANTLRHLSELQALYENGLAINRLMNPREIGERIIDTFARYLSWHHVTIRLRKDGSDDLELIAFSVQDFREDEMAEVERKFNAILKMGQGLSGTVAQSGMPVRTGDLHSRPEFVEIYENMRSGLYMPLKSGDRVIGVISVESEQADAFSEQDERLLATLANQAAIAIENARLYQAAQDQLAERERAEIRLRESETRFRSLIENSSDEVSIIASDGSLLYESPTTSPTLGYRTGEFIGKSLFQLVHPDDIERVLARFDELIQNPDLHPRDRFRLRHHSGAWIWVEAVGTNLLHEPAVGGIVVNYHDVSEQIKAEEQIRYHALLHENISDAVISTDLAGIVVSWNRAAEEMIGHRAEEAIGRPAVEVVDTEYIGVGAETVGTTLQESGYWSGEARITRKDGTAVYCVTSVTTIEDDKKNQLGFLSINHDITERKRAEDTIRSQLERLSGLHTIDIAIKSSFNLQTTLAILLEQVTRQLQVDAACVLVVNAGMISLEFASGVGFRRGGSRNISVRMGESFAGRAIIERRMAQIENLTEDPSHPLLSEYQKGEDFVTYHGMPLIAKGRAIGVLEVYSRSPVRRDEDWVDFFNTLADQAAIAIDNARLFEDLRISNIELANAYEATIEGWSRALDLRDRETEGHTLRVTEMTLALAQQLGLPDEDLVHVRYGALLHDIGKMGVPDGILLKPDKLTEQEWAIMRQHPQFAYELLSPIRYLKSAALDIPYCHHEKWEGTGYPRQLKGEQIPLPARIFAVVDVWDALTSNRPYRPAWTREQALEYIREQSGKHFDPAVVKTFVNFIESK